MKTGRRIFLNVIVTYGRSLIALSCGLFSSRWILQALGETDFGLFGVVGGLVVFIGFLNDLMGSAVGRFYAYAVGQSQRPGEYESGLYECRCWFSSAVFIHSVLAVLIVISGYPIGCWFVDHVLNIPQNRIADCIWVWRFSCVTCFVTVLTVPYQAMFTAKQNIAELTLYTLFTTIFAFTFAYYMAQNPRDWLAYYAAATCFSLTIPRFCIMVRALCVYPECKIVREALFDRDRFAKLSAFAASRFIKAVADIFTSQGMAISANKMLGPSANAAMSIGQSVSAHSMSLASAMSGAFWPAIANAYGAGRVEEMKALTYMTCKLCAIGFLIFAVPLMLESKYILRLWLVNPPQGADVLTSLVLISQAVVLSTEGYWMAIYAKGDIFGYQTMVSIAGLVSVLVAVITILLGLGVVGIGLGWIVGRFAVSLVRQYYGRKVVELDIGHWLRHIAFPIMLIMASAIATKFLVHNKMSASFLRVIVTSLVYMLMLIPLVYGCAMTRQERHYILERFKVVVRKRRIS